MKHIINLLVCTLILSAVCSNFAMEINNPIIFKAIPTPSYNDPINYYYLEQSYAKFINNHHIIIKGQKCHILDIETDAIIKKLDSIPSMSTLFLHPNKELFTLINHETTKIYTTKEMEVVYSWDIYQNDLPNGIFSPTKKSIYTWQEDFHFQPILQEYNCDDPEKKPTDIIKVHDMHAPAMSFHPTKDQFCIQDRIRDFKKTDKCIKIYNYDQDNALKQQNAFQITTPLNSINYSPKGDIIACTSQDRIVIINPETKNIFALYTKKEIKDSIKATTFHPNNSVLAMLFAEKTNPNHKSAAEFKCLLRYLDVNNKDTILDELCLSNLFPYSDLMLSDEISFAPNGEKIMIKTPEEAIILWVPGKVIDVNKKNILMRLFLLQQTNFPKDIHMCILKELLRLLRW